MHIKKYITPFFIIIFIALFSYFNAEEFVLFSQQKTDQSQQNRNLTEKLEDFSLEKIQELEEAHFYYTPYKEFLQKIVDKIDASQKRVYIEVYMLTETRIKESLVRAKKRNIDVKVILEKNPYKAYNINNKHFTFLEKAGINIVWSNPKNYSLNHTKVLIIDDESIISTGNLTYSTFTKNRDFFLVSKDKVLLKHLEQIFESDFMGIKKIIYSHNLVVSPDYSREKFKTLFLGAKKSLRLYLQYFSDDELEGVLIQQAKSGINIEVVISKSSYEQDQKKISFLQEQGIKIIPLDKYTMHAKAILVDEEYLFLGSINFSNYSLDKNREVGIIVKNADVIEDFLDIFNKDFHD